MLMQFIVAIISVSLIPIAYGSYIADSPETMYRQVNLGYDDEIEIVCDKKQDMIQLKKISNGKTVCVFGDSVAKLFERNYLTSMEDDKTFVWIYNNNLPRGDQVTIFGQILDSSKNRFALSMSDHNNIQFGDVEMINLGPGGKFVHKKVMEDPKFSSIGIRNFLINYDEVEIKLPFQITRT